MDFDMSQYDVLDGMVLCILEKKPLHFAELFDLEVMSECNRIAGLTGRQSCRILDGRLQALKRLGNIRYNTHKGWIKL
jgi:hypothetical protein